MKNDTPMLDKDLWTRIAELLPADFDIAMSNVCCVLGMMCEIGDTPTCNYTVHSEGWKSSYKITIQRIETMEVPNE